MCKYIYIIAVLSLTLFKLSFSQDGVTGLDTSVIIRSYSIDEETNVAIPATFDTTLKVVHDYNPIYYQCFSQTFLGNTGQASLTNNLAKRRKNTPFIFSVPYSYYLYTPYNILHFNTRKPFTELQYTSSGSRDDSEQVLSALHTQNVNPNANVGILYDLIASKGIYNNQNTGLNRVILFGSHKKNEYSMHTSLHFNGLRYQENGGIKNLEAFRNRESDALNYLTNLDEATSLIRNLNLYFTHKLNFSALFADSTRKEQFKNANIQHTLDFNRFTRTYSDFTNEQDSLTFYERNYYLSNQITDSAYYHNLSNRIDLNIVLAGTQKLRTYIKHEYKKFSYILPVQVFEKFQYLSPAEFNFATDSAVKYTVEQKFPAKNFHDVSVGGIFQGDLKNWQYTALGSFYLTGYNAGSLLTKGEFTRFFKNKSFFLTMGGKLSSETPSFFLNQYGGAHFIWNNNFKHIENIKAYTSLGNQKDFNVSISLDFYTDYIFINSEAIPEQLENEIFTATLKLNKHFVWGPVNHRHDVLLQKGAKDYINVPLLAYQNSTWYENQVFNKVLKFKIGFDFYYFTSYFADSFMPATAMFYNQNHLKLGNYPFLTGFIDFKLKRTRFSIQYTNALSELLPTANYFMAYGHPNFDGTLRFGLAWTFYD